MGIGGGVLGPANQMMKQGGGGGGAGPSIQGGGFGGMVNPSQLSQQPRTFGAQPYNQDFMKQFIDRISQPKPGQLTFGGFGKPSMGSK